MKKTFIFIFILIFLLVPITSIFAATKTTKKTSPKKITTNKSVKFEHVVYYKPSEGAFVTLQQHAHQVGVFAPQVYFVDDKGVLTGKVSDVVKKETIKNKLPVMPLVSNKDFNRDIMHSILDSTTLQDVVINNLVNEAKLHGYIGWQYDFEAINAEYRDKYSIFVERTARVFKSEKLMLSVAVIARTSENPADLPEGSWDYYAGVYDYKRIGAASDFVTLMSYDNPFSQGPVAEIEWFKETVSYTRTLIPAHKLSVGIPVYAWIWDETANKRLRTSTYDKYLDLIVNNTYTKKGFDKKLGTSWVEYIDHVTKKPYTLWYEDAMSFKLKYDYVKKQKLRGVSIWAIGQEDPEIWKLIK